jgi:hypothetical protein
LDKQLLDRLMAQVEKPVRYMGNEYNMVVKDARKADIRFAFAFPDVYEVGHVPSGDEDPLPPMINQRDDAYCERVFAPWPRYGAEDATVQHPYVCLRDQGSL